MENVHISSAFRKYQRVKYKGVLYHTNTKMPLALACTNYSQQSVSVRPVCIYYFAKHSIQVFFKHFVLLLFLGDGSNDVLVCKTLANIAERSII